MRDIGRIVLKDLRRFWPLMVAAALTAFFLAFFPLLGLSEANASVIDAVGVIRLIVTAFVAVAVVQEDLVVSDRAAWITRPIAPLVLFAAKLLVLLAALVLPFGLVTAAAAHRYDIAAVPALCIAGEQAVKLFAATIFFALVGSLTTSLLMAMFVFGLSAVAFLVLQPYISFGLYGVIGAQTALGSFSTGTLAVAVVFFATALGCHYRWRQLRCTVPAVVCAFLLAALFRHWSNSIHYSEKWAPGVSIAAKHPKGFVGKTLARPFPLEDEVVVGMEIISSFPKDEDYYARPYHATFTATDGRTLSQDTRSGSWINANEAAPSGIETAWNYYPQTAHKELGLTLKDRGSSSIVPVVALPAKVFEKFRGASGSLVLSFSVGRQFAVDRGILPLEAGARVDLPGCRVTLEALRFASGDSLELTLRTSEVVSASAPSNSSLMWALINDRTGEVSLPEYGRDFGGQVESYLLGDSQSSIVFAHRWNRQSGEIDPGISADWLKSARLAYFVPGSSSISEKAEMTLPDFTLPEIGGIQ